MRRSGASSVKQLDGTTRLVCAALLGSLHLPCIHLWGSTLLTNGGIGVCLCLPYTSLAVMSGGAQTPKLK